MSTGNIVDWTGNMADIGPLYPFVGSEGLLFVLGMAFWIGWHVWQIRMENANYRDDSETLRQNNNMDKALRGERVLRPL
jgi:hypothetical protein